MGKVLSFSPPHNQQASGKVVFHTSVEASPRRLNQAVISIVAAVGTVLMGFVWGYILTAVMWIISIALDLPFAEGDGLWATLAACVMTTVLFFAIGMSALLQRMWVERHDPLAINDETGP